VAWPDGGINEVVKSIGSGVAPERDHSTIAAWEAATDGNCTTGWSGDYADPCSPVGDCYDDDDFSESGTLFGATTDSTHYRRLTVHAGQRHAGKEGAGATIACDTSYGWILQDQHLVWEWFILTGVGDSYGPYYCPENSRHMVRNMVGATTGNNTFLAAGPGAGTEFHIRNCNIYGMAQYGIFGDSVVHAQNCSVFGVWNYLVCRSVCTNVIAVKDGAGTAIFYICTGDYNISSDTSAPGDHSIHNITPADLFESIVDGSEDLHLKSDATAASNAGDDLSASFTIDIDGETRVDWDIGADEYGAPTFNPSWYVQRRRAREVA